MIWRRRKPPPARNRGRKPYAKLPLTDMIEALARELTAWQNRDYAERFKIRVAQIRAAETRVAPGSEVLSRAFALGYYKLLAFKDEYEIAPALLPVRNSWPT